VLVAVIAVAMMIGPGLMIGGKNLSPTDNASAVGTGRVLRIGWPDFFLNVATLNPHTMTMGQEFMIILPCYSNLLTYDENGKTIYDLATKYTVSPDGKDFHFWIVHTASFYDKNVPGTQVPLTVDDVMFSFWLAQNNSKSIMNYYFPKDPVTSQPLITSMTKINNYEMIFHLRMSFAPFSSALVGVPILPMYIWQGKAIGWANYDHQYPPCVGSGPYYYALDNIADIQTLGSSNVMNPTYFGIVERGWQPKVYEFKVKSETQASGISNFQAGNLDVLISPSPADWVNYPAGGAASVVKFSSSQGFVLDMCINQLTPANAAKYGMTGLGNQLLLDPTVKYALKASVDKSDIVNFSLYGGGSPADSLMPGVSPWYYDYGSSPQDTKNIPDQGDVLAARHALWDAGWKYTISSPTTPVGRDDLTATPLCKVGGTQILSFRFIWADWYAFIEDEGPRIVNWAADAGIELLGAPASSAEMNAAWKSGDYDVYLWDWWFGPNAEPSLDVMELYNSNSIGNNTDVNDANATYDAMYYQSLIEPNVAARHALIDDMQRWAYENSGYWPIAYRDNQYLVQSVSPNYWSNWGDWNNHYTLCPDSNFWWLFYRLNPADNPAPTISTFSIDPADTTHPITYTVAVTDSNTLSYKWMWGDGTSTGWSTSYNQAKTYTDDGYYEARLLAMETSGNDGYISYAMQKVTVLNYSNAAPVPQAWTPSPSNPTAGELVYFNGSATDANPGDTLSYSWDFGDNTTASGQSVTHRFPAAAIYSVTLSVDDGHIGLATRPVPRTQSVQVTVNSPPIISVGDYPSVVKGKTTTFTCAASDSNIRDVLKFTWVWGDGGVSVTTTQSTRHTYDHTGDYTLRVWADDGTGITSPPHNASDTGLVHVVNSGVNHAPTLLNYTVSNANPWTGQAVTFWATPIDLDGDILDVTFVFGDGFSSGVITQSAPNATVSVTHAYMTASDWFPSVIFTDTIAAPVTKYSTDMSPAWWVTSHGSYFVLNLGTGWNMVSLPLVGFGYKASTLGLLTDDVVSGYNTSTKVYDQNYIVGRSPARNDFTLVESTGYWIYAGGARVLRISGNVPTGTQTLTVTVPVGGGWAIIGFLGLNATRHASDIKTMYSGGTVTTVAGYITATGAYQVYIGTPRTDFLLVPGQGYWIYVTASGVLTYTP
jgi:ABC-type transport system substrate-binding protein